MEIKGIVQCDCHQPSTNINAKGLLEIRWNFHDLKRYDFDCFLLDKDWQAVPTLQDACNFGIWINAFDYCILTYDQGEGILVKCYSYDMLHSELRAILDALQEEE